MKNLELIPMTEEISKHPSTDSVVWLFVVILMKIYDENKQIEKDKLQNLKLKEKGNMRKWNRAKSSVQGDKQIKKFNKTNGDLRAGSYPAKFPTFAKELKKSLEQGIVVNDFRPSTDEVEAVEADKSLSLKSALSTEQVSNSQYHQAIMVTMKNRDLIKV